MVWAANPSYTKNIRLTLNDHAFGQQESAVHPVDWQPMPGNHPCMATERWATVEMVG